jgi:hypothetical protein
MTCSILELQIVSRAPLDLTFRPTQANLTIIYNGARIDIKVRAKSIYASVHTLEGCFPVELCSGPGARTSLTWGTIIQEILGEVISTLTIHAVNNQLFLKQEGQYFVQ